ncbi:MAG TPA: Na+/H+ antiporter subunit E [Candidatus Thermoplasmatota archaeon]|nr:Na+/H+ antiporter subunit E [Candidatus Thermoplasmatota archaeon]
MNPLLWNLILTMAWVLLTGNFSLPNLLLGLLIGYLIISFAQVTVGPVNYARKVLHAIAFAVLYLKEVLLANVQIAIDILTPRMRARPCIVAIPLGDRSDAEITLLASLLTMTPGTLSLDVSDDKKTLFIHAMYVRDVEELRRHVQRNFGDPVAELMR